MICLSTAQRPSLDTFLDDSLLGTAGFRVVFFFSFHLRELRVSARHAGQDSSYKNE